jgi:hypothetical protein
MGRVEEQAAQPPRREELRRIRRLAALALVTAASLASLAPAAQADGDPASDILLYQQAYLPYGQILPARIQQNVQQVAANANAAGFPLRVAVLGSEDDMGAVVAMYGKPRQYARFLHAEFVAGPASYTRHAASASRARSGAAARAAQAALLVVMPNGYGVAGPVPTAAERAVESTPLDARDGLALGEAAVNGTAKLAGASGHPIDVPVDPLAEAASSDTGGATRPPVAARRASPGGSGAPWAAIAAGAVALLAGAGGLLLLRRRRGAAVVRKMR